MELYIHSSIRLHGVMLIEERGIYEFDFQDLWNMENSKRF
jgi:hypothetical protein